MSLFFENFYSVCKMMILVYGVYIKFIATLFLELGKIAKLEGRHFYGILHRFYSIYL